MIPNLFGGSPTSRNGSLRLVVSGAAFWDNSIWLVVEPYPFEKYDFVNWDNSSQHGKIKNVLTTNQVLIGNWDVQKNIVWECPRTAPKYKHTKQPRKLFHDRIGSLRFKRCQKWPLEFLRTPVPLAKVPDIICTEFKEPQHAPTSPVTSWQIVCLQLVLYVLFTWSINGRCFSGSWG